MPVQTAPASSKQKPRVRNRTRPKAARQPEARELQELLEHLRNLDLPEEDGEPLESDFHVMQIPLLDEVVRQHLGETN
ncbi:MAG: hypothetical protein N2554_09080, partial [Fimbriimonadales bacterium]|nr:hypothetical protein [Fimbriimonadales bacterium]